MKEYFVEPLVVANPDANAASLLKDRAALTPDRPIFGVPAGDGWEDVTAAEFLAEVRAVAKGLIASGIEPGDKIGIICSTRYEWTLIDFATWFAGAILVPIYETSSPTQIEWILSDSGSRAVIVETGEHYAKLDEVLPELPQISPIFSLARNDLQKLRDAGKDVPDSEVDRRATIAKGSDVATLIYTAGTTGSPKGCVLTHSNFVELSKNAALALPEVINQEGSSTVLFITVAHVFARFITTLCVHGGVKVAHQADTKHLLEAMGSFQPTFLLAVPRVFEKVYNSAEQKAESGGKGAIFRKAADAAVEYSTGLSSGKLTIGMKLKNKVFDLLVYSKIRKAMGGHVRYVVSGSAPLGPRLGHFFHTLGIVILEGYGLTETTAPATVNLAHNFKIGTVGPPLPGVGVRISDDNEVQVRGINVFDGYWKNPEATAEAFDGEWFRTGDLGSMDDEGFVTITGRIKEIIVTAGGKNVAPAALEDPIRANPVVGQIVVLGDKRRFISALITLDSEMLPTWLANNGENPEMSLAEASKNSTVLAEVQRAVDAANSRVSRAESIREFRVLPIEFTEANGHLTPKMSIKRHVILQDFSKEIDEIYA